MNEQINENNSSPATSILEFWRNINHLGRRSFKKYTISRKSKDGGKNEIKQSKKSKKEDGTVNKQKHHEEVETTQINENHNNSHFEDECCKKKVGYLVKSPSKICFRNKIARWHLRWFVLYDNQPRCDTVNEERVVELLYYKNHREEQINAQPLGERIILLYYTL